MQIRGGNPCTTTEPPEAPAAAEAPAPLPYLPAYQRARLDRAMEALADWLATHNGEGPCERDWRGASGYGHSPHDMMAFMHDTEALQRAGRITQDARLRYALPVGAEVS